MGAKFCKQCPCVENNALDQNDLIVSPRITDEPDPTYAEPVNANEV